jgi:hypothetical protein
MDDAPASAFPFVPPIAFDWQSSNWRTIDRTAAQLVNSAILYDECHPRAAFYNAQDLLYSRATTWYLITRTAGNVEIRTRLVDLNNPQPGHAAFEGTIHADELLNPDQKAMLSARNAFMANFNKIGMPILKAHMPVTPPDVAAFASAIKAKSVLRNLARTAYANFGTRDSYWPMHPSWLSLFFAFTDSTEAQRSILYLEIASAGTGSWKERLKVTLGDQMIGGSLVDVERGLVLRGRYVLEPVLDMVARGFVEADLEAGTFNLSGRGAELADALRPIRKHFRFYDFVVPSRDEIDASRLDEAHAWIVDFFTRMKVIGAQQSSAAE